MAAADSHLMQCMEVFGGNHRIDRAVSMAGLDAWVFSEPHAGSASGGDVHYLSSCATGRISRFLVADVSGHGAAVSGIAEALRALMRRYVNTIDQTRLIESLNREFVELSDEGAFASAVVATYWAPTSYLVLSNAGHPRPIHRRAATGTWSPLEPLTPQPSLRPVGDPEPGRAGPGMQNTPLGVFEPARYGETRVSLEPGDLVLVYTDSLTEAKDAAGRALSEAGLVELLSGLDATKPERIVAQLLSAFERSGRRPAASDDLTVLLVRHTGAQAPKMTIKAWWRALRDFAGMAAKAPRSLPWPEWTLANLGGALFPRLSRRWGGRSEDAGDGERRSAQH
jgi:sigma-B regulation protein RsbU (phosphoserine phosphatase)